MKYAIMYVSINVLNNTKKTLMFGRKQRLINLLNY